MIMISHITLIAGLLTVTFFLFPSINPSTIIDRSWITCEASIDRKPIIVHEAQGILITADKATKTINASNANSCRDLCFMEKECVFAKFELRNNQPVNNTCYLFDKTQKFYHSQLGSAIFMLTYCNLSSNHYCTNIGHYSIGQYKDHCEGIWVTYLEYNLTKRHISYYKNNNSTSISDMQKKCLESYKCGAMTMRSHSNGTASEFQFYSKWSPIFPNETSLISDKNSSVVVWTCCDQWEHLDKECCKDKNTKQCSQYWSIKDDSVVPPVDVIYAEPFHTVSSRSCRDECTNFNSNGTRCLTPWYSVEISICILQIQNGSSKEPDCGRQPMFQKFPVRMRSYELRQCSNDQPISVENSDNLDNNILLSIKAKDCVRLYENITVFEDVCDTPQQNKSIINGMYGMAFTATGLKKYHSDINLFQVTNGWKKMWFPRDSFVYRRKNENQSLCEIYNADFNIQGNPVIQNKSEWGGQNEIEPSTNITKRQFVLISQTFVPACGCFSNYSCTDVLRARQEYYQAILGHHDIDFNFYIAPDGTVYEGRGWHKAPIITFAYIQISFCISFIGSYEKHPPTPKSVMAAKLLINLGLRYKYIADDYTVHGLSNITRDTTSHQPGDKLLSVIRGWPNYVVRDHSTPPYCPNKIVLYSSFGVLVALIAIIFSGLIVHYIRDGFHSVTCQLFRRKYGFNNVNFVHSYFTSFNKKCVINEKRIFRKLGPLTETVDFKRLYDFVQSRDNLKLYIVLDNTSKCICNLIILEIYQCFRERFRNRVHILQNNVFFFKCESNMTGFFFLSSDDDRNDVIFLFHLPCVSDVEEAFFNRETCLCNKRFQIIDPDSETSILSDDLVDIPWNLSHKVNNVENYQILHKMLEVNQSPGEWRYTPYHLDKQIENLQN